MTDERNSATRIDPAESGRSVDDRASMPAGGNAHRITFRVWTVITSLWFLLLYGIGALELVAMWLPGEAILSMFEEEQSILIHRTHFLIVGILSWALLLATFVQLRKPERRVAPMIQLVIMALGAGLVYALSGTVEEWLVEEGLVLLPILVLAVLHPSFRELVRRPSFDRDMTALAGLATVPWAVYIVVNARLQLINAAGDAHAEIEHWATATLLGITVLACAYIGSTDHRGWRLSAWIAAGASLILGVHSLVFPGFASSLAPLWAGLAIAWGVAFAVVIVRRSGRASVDPSAVPSQP